MSEEKLVAAMQEGRMIAAVDNVIYPMIDLMITNRIGTMVQKFRASKNDELISDVAYIAALKDLQSNLKSKQTAGNSAYQKLGAE